MCQVTPPAELDLPMGPDAAARSREFMGTAICRTHHGTSIENTQLLVSELVTNGVRYGAPPVVLRVECESPQSLLVLVRDGSPELPKVTHAEPEDESGRGMFLVDYISDEWGAEPTDHGKVTWFRLNN
jgi:anti-sigma regulatory factor (Ser/Thr protein kinase)